MGKAGKRFTELDCCGQEQRGLWRVGGGHLACGAHGERAGLLDYEDLTQATESETGYSPAANWLCVL